MLDSLLVACSEENAPVSNCSPIVIVLMSNGYAEIKELWDSNYNSY